MVGFPKFEPLFSKMAFVFLLFALAFWFFWCGLCFGFGTGERLEGIEVFYRRGKV